MKPWTNFLFKAAMLTGLIEVAEHEPGVSIFVIACVATVGLMTAFLILVTDLLEVQRAEEENLASTQQREPAPRSRLHR